MPRLLAPVIVVAALLLAFGSAGCGGKSSAEDIADSLEDRLTDALSLDGGQREDGAPGEGLDSAEAPQVADAELPSELTLGEPFVLSIDTTFDAGDTPLKAVIYVKGASRHIHVEAPLEPLEAGGRMLLFGVLNADLKLKDRRFNLEVALKTRDGVMGLPFAWPLEIRNEEPPVLSGEPIDFVTLDGEEWNADGRPAGDPSDAAPQVLRIEGPEGFPSASTRRIGLLSRNVTEPDEIAAVLLAVPGNPGYKRSTRFWPVAEKEGLLIGVDLTLNADLPVGTRLVLLFALENNEEKVGLFKPYVFEVVEAGDEPDGDEPDGDKPDGDEPDGDADGDEPDGDADGDEPDGDEDGDVDEEIPCVCEVRTACCDGCRAINEDGPCDPQTQTAWNGYCDEGACLPLAFSQHSLHPDSYMGASALSADGERLVTCAGRSIRVWDLTQDFAPVGNFDEILAPEITYISNLDLSPLGNRLVITNFSPTIFVYDPIQIEFWDTILVPTAQGVAQKTRFSADGSVLWVGANSLIAYRMRDRRVPFYGATIEVGGVSWLERIAEGPHMVGAGPNSYQLFDLLNGNLYAVVSVSEHDMNDFTASPDGLEVASLACTAYGEMGCTQFSVTRWSLATGQSVQTRSFDLPLPSSLAWSPGGDTLAVSHCDAAETGMPCQSSSVLLLDRPNLATLVQMTDFPDAVSELFYDRQGTHLIALGSNGYAVRWELGPFSPPFAWECSEQNACPGGFFCDLYAHRCRPDACTDNVDNDSDGMTDGNDFDCSLGAFMEVGEEPIGAR